MTKAFAAGASWCTAPGTDPLTVLGPLRLPRDDHDCIGAVPFISRTTLQGAFSVAVKTGSPVVPITLIGTGKLMPNGQESRLYGGRGVKIVVHPRIQVQTLQGTYTCARP